MKKSVLAYRVRRAAERAAVAIVCRRKLDQPAILLNLVAEIYEGEPPIPRKLVLQLLAAYDEALKLDTMTGGFSAQRVGTPVQRQVAWNEVHRVRAEIMGDPEPKLDSADRDR